MCVDTDFVSRATSSPQDGEAHESGYAYKKAGIMLGGISSARAQQQEAFFEEAGAGPKSVQLMAALDTLNRKFGRDVVAIGATAITQKWVMRSDRKTQSYTTSWDELPVVRAN